MTAMDLEPRVPATGEIRSYTAVEKFLLVTCFLMPGSAACGLIVAYMLLSWNLFGKDAYPAIAFVIPGVLILLGSCFFAGLIVASRRGEEERGTRTIKSALRFLLDQIVFLTVVGMILALVGGG